MNGPPNRIALAKQSDGCAERMVARDISRLTSGLASRVPQRHWVRGDPYPTALFNALSVIFPHGETFMIRSLAAWRGKLPEKLADDVEAFIQQEAGHSREHLALNRFVTRTGYDIRPLERAIRDVAAKLKAKNDIGGLCATACIEHFTAILAAELLRHPHHLDGIDSDLRALWIWHAVEELEHKGVAYDVWDYVTRDWSRRKRYWMRIKVMLLITLSFLINRTSGQIELLQQDDIGKWRAIPGVWREGLNKKGLLRAIIKPWAAFFRPSFHPWQQDDRALISESELLLTETLAFAMPNGEEVKERRQQPRFARAA